MDTYRIKHMKSLLESKIKKFKDEKVWQDMFWILKEYEDKLALEAEQRKIESNKFFKMLATKPAPVHRIVVDASDYLTFENIEMFDFSFISNDNLREEYDIHFNEMEKFKQRMTNHIIGSKTNNE
jgi:hypothetical protein